MHGWDACWLVCKRRPSQRRRRANRNKIREPTCLGPIGHRDLAVLCLAHQARPHGGALPSRGPELFGVGRAHWGWTSHSRSSRSGGAAARSGQDRHPRPDPPETWEAYRSKNNWPWTAVAELGMRNPARMHGRSRVVGHRAATPTAGTTAAATERVPRGDALPFGSRMLAIADAFDAMTTDTVYRPAMSRERAIQELIDGSCTQFDPELAIDFNRMLEQRPEMLQGVIVNRWLQQLQSRSSP